VSFRVKHLNELLRKKVVTIGDDVFVIYEGLRYTLRVKSMTPVFPCAIIDEHTKFILESGTDSKLVPNSEKNKPALATVADDNEIADSLKHARDLINANMYPEAELIVDQVLVLSPDNSKALNLKGKIIHDSGRTGDARVYFEKAAALEPTDLLLKATLMYNLGKHDEALGTVTEYVKSHEHDSAAWELTGMIHAATGKYMESVKCLTSSLALDPDSVSAFNFKERILQTLEQSNNVVLCWQCGILIGKHAFAPLPYWEMGGKLCGPCYQFCTESTSMYRATYLEKLSYSFRTSDGILILFSLNRRVRFIFEPYDKTMVPIIMNRPFSVQKVKKYTPEDFVPLETNEKTETSLVRVEWASDGGKSSAIFDISDASEAVERMAHFIAQTPVPTIDTSRSSASQSNSPRNPSVSPPDTPLPKCSSCGRTVNKSDIRFGMHSCIHCGSKLLEDKISQDIPFERRTNSSDSLSCRECGNSNPLDAIFCGKCGREFTLLCSRCSRQNPKGSHFCNQCGTKL
jgi:hypothetical protein